MTAWKREKMPAHHRWAGAAEYGGRLYWTGGDTREGVPGGEVWSCGAQSGWRRHDDMPVAVSWHGCAVLEGKLYCIGGRDSYGPTCAVQIFDFATESWSLGPPLPEAVWQHAAARFKGGILCTGGVREGKTLNETLFFTPSEGGWLRYPELSAPRRGHCCLNVDGTLYCVGGSTVEGLRSAVAMELLSPTNEAWLLGAATPSPRWTGSAAAVGNVIFHAGSDNRLHLYSIGDRCWKPGAPIPRNASGARLHSLAGRLLLSDDSGSLWR